MMKPKRQSRLNRVLILALLISIAANQDRDSYQIQRKLIKMLTFYKETLEESKGVG